MSESQEKDFFVKFELSKFDRGLFLLIILSHGIALFEPVKKIIEEHFTVETGLTVYLICLTAFWTIFFATFCAKQVKEKQAELLKFKEESKSAHIELETNHIAEVTRLKKDLSELTNVKGYVQAYEHIGLGFAKIHQMQRQMSQIHHNSIEFEGQMALMIKNFQEVCTHIADGFNLITGTTDISVCIKLASGSKEITKRSSVYTLVRDSRSASRRSYNEAGNLHVIDNNTSYSQILRLMSNAQNGRCFFCNNLPQLPQYKNTSFSNYGQAIWNNSLSPEQHNNDWKLPYRSTVVTGVYPNQSEFFENKWLIGYLCIDSSKIDSFHEKFDVPVLTGIADGIYNTLKQFKQLKDKNHDTSKRLPAEQKRIG